MKANQKQLHILRHSLGLDDEGRGKQYRNHFATGPDGEDWNNCQALVAGGLMRDGGKIVAWGNMNYFAVTDAGKYEVACQHPATPRLTKGQQRYRNWLHLDNGLTFGEWLKSRRVTTPS